MKDKGYFSRAFDPVFFISLIAFGLIPLCAIGQAREKPQEASPQRGIIKSESQSTPPLFKSLRGFSPKPLDVPFNLPTLIERKDFPAFFEEFIRTFEADDRIPLIRKTNQILTTLYCQPKTKDLLIAELASPASSPSMKILAGLLLSQLGEYQTVLQVIRSTISSIDRFASTKTLPPNPKGVIPSSMGKEGTEVSTLASLILGLGVPPPYLRQLDPYRATCQSNKAFRSDFQRFCGALAAHPSTCVEIHQTMFPPPEDHQTPIRDPQHFLERQIYVPYGTYTLELPAWVLDGVDQKPPQEKISEPPPFPEGMPPLPAAHKILFYPVLPVQMVRQLLVTLSTPSSTLLTDFHYQIRQVAVELLGRYLYDPLIQKTLYPRLTREKDPEVLRPLMVHFLNYLYGMGLYHPERFKRQSSGDLSPGDVTSPVAPIRSGAFFERVIERFWALGSEPKNPWARKALSPEKFGYLLRAYPTWKKVEGGYRSNDKKTAMEETLLAWFRPKCESLMWGCIENGVSEKEHQKMLERIRALPAEAGVWAVKLLWWFGVSNDLLNDKWIEEGINVTEPIPTNGIVEHVFIHHEKSEVRAAAASALRGLDSDAEAEKLWFDTLPKDPAWQVRKAICKELLTKIPRSILDQQLKQLAKGFIKNAIPEIALTKFSEKVLKAPSEKAPADSRTASLQQDVERTKKTEQEHLKGDYEKYQETVKRWKTWALTEEQEKILNAQFEKETHPEVRACLRRILHRP